MADTVIEVRELTKTYHLGDVEVRALRGVSLTIERGDFVAIMGASGSGKSTLMNVIGCLDLPSSGSYLLEGVDVATLSEPELASIRSRRIGFVFQASICCREPARWKTSSCLCCIPTTYFI